VAVLGSDSCAVVGYGDAHAAPAGAPAISDAHRQLATVRQRVNGVRHQIGEHLAQLTGHRMHFGTAAVALFHLDGLRVQPGAVQGEHFIQQALDIDRFRA
jgi:hypothetical protein